MNRAKQLVFCISIFCLPILGKTSTKHLANNTFFSTKVKALQQNLYSQLNLNSVAISSAKKQLETTTTTKTTSSATFFNTAEELIPVGSFIINMGVILQTVENGLKPYGLVWELLNTHRIPIKWIIKSGKAKDEADFFYNGVAYRGGSFIIPAAYRTTEVNNTINNWIGKGVIGETTNSPLTVPVAQTLSYSITWTLDDNNGKIAEKYLEAAEIPTTGYNWVEPENLNCCSDIFVIPHADPDWESYQNLLNWNDRLENGGCRGAIWAGCQAVSNLENLINPNNGAQRLNFLMNNPPNPNRDAAIDHGNHKDSEAPYNYDYHDHPIMQFVGLTDDAQESGSEQVYLPERGWRPTTLIGIWDPDHEDIPSKSSGPAAKMAFGPAFGDTNRGHVFYEGGHDLDGDDPENVAAIRAFFNFSFMAAGEKAIKVTGNIPQTINSGQTYSINSSVIGGTGTYNYQWTSNCGGVFSNPNGAVTNFTPVETSTEIDCLIKLIVTDDCGNRYGYYANKTVISPPSIISSCPYTDFVVNAMPTYESIANGNWNSATTWQGGNIPSSNLSGLTVNINHEVTRNGNLNVGNGILNILGVLTLPNDEFFMSNAAGVANIDHGVLILVNSNFSLSGGTLNLNYGGIHICNGNYLDSSSGGTNGNGYIYSANGNIQDFQNGNFSSSVAWCSPGGTGIGLPTSEDCTNASPPGGCGDTNFYKTLCDNSGNAKVLNGTVFRDDNEDGLNNDGINNGISGVTVYIYNDKDQNGQVNVGDELVATQSTNIEGEFSYIIDGSQEIIIATDDFSDATWNGGLWNGGRGWNGGWNDNYGESGGNLGPNLGTNGGGGWNVGIVNCNQTNNHNNCEPFGTPKLSLENDDYISRPIDLSGYASVDFTFDLETVANNDSDDVLTIKVCTDVVETNCTTLYTNGLNNGNFAPNPITISATLNDPTFLTADAHLFFHIEGFSGSAEYVYIDGLTATSSPTLTHFVITTDSSTIGGDQYYVTDNVESAVFGNIGGIDTDNNFGIGTGILLQNDTWLDLNANGIQEPIEIGIPNMGICISNTSPLLINGVNIPANNYFDTVYTDLNGLYSFENLPDCNWEMEVHYDPAFHIPTYDADGDVLAIVDFELENGQINAANNPWCQSNNCVDELDFGFRLSGEFNLSGTICIDDSSKDGHCGTGGEEVFEGLRLLLYDDEGTFFGGVTNNNDGVYTFPFLPMDTYIVSLSTGQQSIDTLLLTTKLGDTPASEILIGSRNIFQKVLVAQDIYNVDYAFVPHFLEESVRANDDEYKLCPSTTFNNSVSLNDTVFSELVIYTLLDEPESGFVDFENNGAFEYTATEYICGVDQFIYQLCNLSTAECDTAMVTLNFSDDNAPTLNTIPANITISCDEVLPDPALVSAYDNCPRIAIDLEELSTQGEDGCSQYDYELTRTWIAADLCDNKSEGVQRITVQDVVAPDVFRIYTLPNGKKMLAGVTEFTGERWKTVTFPINFDTQPFVFTQVVTNKETTPVITQIRNVSKAQFELHLKEEEANDDIHNRESVAWIAIEEGLQTEHFGLVADIQKVDEEGKTINFPTSFSDTPALFVTAQTTDESDPFVINFENLTKDGVTLSLVEEQSNDVETNHINERIAYLGIEKIGDIINEEEDIIGEVGTAMVTDNPTEILLNHTYHNPVVIVNGTTNQPDFPGIFRIDEVTPNSFEVQVQAWSYLNNPASVTEISYLVIEGSIPLYTPDFCDTGTDDLIIGTDIKVIDNCDNSVELNYVETKRFDGAVQLIDRVWSATDECGNAVSYMQQVTCEGIAVKIKTLLQGALIGSSEPDLMRDDLRKKGLIPSIEPYSQLPNFNHVGRGGGEELLPELLAITGPNAIVDWVLLEIRAKEDIEKVVATSSGLLQRDGDVISATGDSLIVFENVPFGDYYISARHRNHIGVTTKNTYTFGLNNIPELNFINVFTPTEGNQSGIKLGDRKAQWSGDLNGDGKTVYQGPYNDPFEMFLQVILDEENSQYLVNFINKGYTERDFNLDGSVIFQGPNNDRSNLLFHTILVHPENDKVLANFIISTGSIGNSDDDENGDDDDDDDGENGDDDDTGN